MSKTANETIEERAKEFLKSVTAHALQTEPLECTLTAFARQETAAIREDHDVLEDGVRNLQTIARAFLEGQEWVPAENEPDGPGKYLVTIQDTWDGDIYTYLGEWSKLGGWDTAIMSDSERVIAYRKLPPPFQPEDEKLD